MERRWLLIITTLYVLVGSTAALSARFSSSAAFERPIHLSILTLLVSGAVLLVVARRARADLPSAIQLVPPSAVQTPFRTVPSAAPLSAAKSLLHSLRRLRIGSASLTLLIACITCRTIVFRRIIRSIHCSRDGLHAFLPVLLALAETKGRPAASSGRHGYFPELGRTSLGPSTRYIVLAATWGWSATQMYLSPSGAVGSICPPGWRWEPFVPFAQVFVVLLDAAAIDYTSRLWQRHQAVGPCSALLSSAFLSSSAILTLLSILFFTLHDSDIAWAFRIHDVRARHLALDTLLASSALLSSVFLLSSVRSSAIAVLFSATGLSAELCLRLVDSAATLASLGSWAVGILGLASVAALLHFDRETVTATCFRGESPHRALMTLYWGLLAVLVTLYVAAVPRPYSIEPIYHAIPSLAEAHGRMSETWVATARQSTTFDEAVAEYKRRYRIPPPPNFDKWYEFAVSWNSTIIDSFDQVSSDLRPFWGVVPSVIRARTAHLVESPSLRIGGLRIRKGEIKLSPHTPGTHRWMMDANAAMMKPFARWLPDMDLAFNLDDECRVALPFTDSRLLHVAARQSQARLAELDTAKLTGFAKAEDAAVRWPSKYFEPDSAPGVAAKSPHFRDNTRRQLFYDVVTPACPPDSRARQSVWWNRKALCTACLQRHTLSAPGMHVVSDWAASGDVCHQPDLAYLHGFITSPAPMLGTNRLFPIFSQARTAGFSDVLVPSPWSFVDKTVYEPAEDVPWEQKNNTLFWRGSPSDGFAINGGWEGFPRARFVHAAQRVAAGFDTPGWMAHEHETGQCSDGVCGRPFGVNVSFVGEFRKCHEPDCIAEADTFYRYGGGSRPKSGHHVEGGRDASFLPPPVPFSDHWAFRHLIDFDGAGFSGRFVPFLLSRSLVYRVALFRTWYEERVHAWRHYVPVDVRLGKGLWGIVNFFAGKHGEGLGRRIAEDGRDWAAQVLRKEDMQIYMFRLLLEWGRVVDDQREEIGWSY